MVEKTKREKLMLSLPGPLKSWLQELAEENCTTANAEVVRSLRERRARMEAAAREGA